MTSIGERVKMERERRGWSQAELARKMNEAGWPKYTQVTVSKTEKGMRDPRIAESAALERILGIGTLGLVAAASGDLYDRGYQDGLAAAVGGPQERHLSPQELAERYGLPVQTLYGWRVKHKGPRAMRIGKHVRYRIEDVLAWEESQLDPLSEG